MINIDKDHLWMVSADSNFFDERGSQVSIPLRHGTGLLMSIMKGDRPSEAGFGVVHFDQDPDPLLRDLTLAHCNVQEPFDQFATAQFSINIAEKPTEPMGLPDGFRDAIRLGATRWVSGALVHEWKDLPITAASDHYFTGASERPGTPVQGWNINTVFPFDSGVLFRIGNEWRILAAHHVGVATPGPTQTDVTEFRWYLIDPDLGNYPGANWSPQIVEHPQTGDQIIGRAPTGGIADPHMYQGVIGVNVNGQATISFTRSGSSTSNGWPTLIRAVLTSDYSDVQYVINAASQAGPAQALHDGSAFSGWLGWAYADIEPAPDHCGHWTVGTLVGFADAEPEPPVTSNRRAIWVTEIYDPCSENAEMNGDGVVDAADLALYLDHYAKGTPQADMDGDGKVDSLDYLIYSEEYAKR